MEPQSKEEYEARFYANSSVDGWGIDVAQHLACPFCCAANYLTLHPAWGIADDRPDIDTQMETPATCKECGRSTKAIVKRTSSGVEFEIVQVGGPNPPDVPWIPPIRRIDGE